MIAVAVRMYIYLIIVQVELDCTSNGGGLLLAIKRRFVGGASVCVQEWYISSDSALLLPTK